MKRLTVVVESDCPGLVEILAQRTTFSIETRRSYSSEGGNITQKSMDHFRFIIVSDLEARLILGWFSQHLYNVGMKHYVYEVEDYKGRLIECFKRVEGPSANTKRLLATYKNSSINPGYLDVPLERDASKDDDKSTGLCLPR